MFLDKYEGILSCPQLTRLTFKKENFICSNVNSLQIRTDSGENKSHIFINWLVRVYILKQKKY